MEQVFGGVLVVEAAGEGRIGQHQRVLLLLTPVLLRQRVAVADVRVLYAVQQHVHAANAQHGVVEVEAVEQAVVEVLAQLRVVQQLGVALAQVLARRDQEARGTASRVADDVGGLGRGELHHEPDDVARRAELPVLSGGGDHAEHVLVDVALGVAFLQSLLFVAHFALLEPFRLDRSESGTARPDEATRGLAARGLLRAPAPVDPVPAAVQAARVF